MANRLKLTPEVAAKIVNLVKGGNFRETAAAACGIDPKTLRRWLALGAKGRAPYADFAAAVEQASASSEAHDVLLITKAGAKDWKALAWRLERKNAKQWGFRVKVEVNEQLEEVLEKLQQGLDAPTFRRVLEIITDEGAGAAPAPSADRGPAERPH